MLSADRLSINTFDKTAFQTARKLGLGLEVEEYLWTYTEEEIAHKRRRIPEMMSGFSRHSFHGTVVSRDVVGINNLSDGKLLFIYNEFYQNARFHGIDKIVYHSNYLATMQTPDVWVSRRAAFWKEFKTLDRVHIALCPGQMVMLLGPSGSGKSTLATCFARTEPLDSERNPFWEFAIAAGVQPETLGYLRGVLREPDAPQSREYGIKR